MMTHLKAGGTALGLAGVWVPLLDTITVLRIGSKNLTNVKEP